jgi:L-2-hydroxyglutarate oxidase LhgO
VATENCDVLIVGAGAIGLSVGIALLESNPSLKVSVAEKESHVGLHASGRNSGVLHAGFYYSPDSLKARFCRDGNFELKQLCKEGGIPVNTCGKVVVTQNEEEEARLDLLFSRGIANGVELEIHKSELMTKYEPLATTHRRFLWSPNTAISDSGLVISYMLKKFQKMGGKVLLSKKLRLFSRSGEVSLNEVDIEFKHLVNAAGAQSDRLSKSLGISDDYSMIPFMGVYRATKLSNLPLRTLVYPVPHPINPFLGVHFTLTLDQMVKIGPTAIPILGREQYSITKGWSLFDLSQAIKGTHSLIRGEAHDFSTMVKSEWPKLIQREIVKQAAELVPEALNVNKWKRRPPGIRAQLVHLPTGKLEQDFVVRNYQNSTHILNAVSPGWTSSIPFGRYVAKDFVIPFLN